MDKYNSVNEFIQDHFKVFEFKEKDKRYVATSPDGKVYKKGDQSLLGIPEDKFVIPFVPPRNRDDVHPVGRPRSRSNRK